MKPYYDEDGITIYHGNCREVLPQLDAASVDLVLTDPPFFMPAVHCQSRVRWQRSWGDVSILGVFWGAMVDLILPTMRRTGHLIAFCNGDSYPVFYPEMYRHFDTLKCLVWDKGHVGLGRIWRHQHELAIAARWADSYVGIAGELYADVLRAKATPSSQRAHPVDKPPSLLVHMIKPVTVERGLVLDPFMGGGSTLIAAQRLNRRAIGIETEEKYCEVAVERLRNRSLLAAM